MKRLLFVLFIFFMFIVSVNSVLAEGDKVRGEGGSGVMVGEPTPALNCEAFAGNCPYGSYNP